jgi:hypothetical protein
MVLMGFLDDLVDIAKSAGKVSNELKGLRDDVLTTIDDVKTEAKKMVDPTKVDKPSNAVKKSTPKTKPKTKASDTK